MRLYNLIVVCGPVSATTALNHEWYVDLFIGTQGSVSETSCNGGKLFPGASFAFGAVKVAIDTTEFSEISMKIGMKGEDRGLRITAENLDEEAGSVYLQGFRVNGIDWDRSWVGHEDLMLEAGGNATLEFVLGEDMREWDV